MRQVLLGVLLVGSCLMLWSGCASRIPPNTSTEAKVAIKGNQVVTALRGTIPIIKSNVCQPSRPAPCINADDAVKIFGLLEKAGGTAEELATALAVVDAATNPTERTTALEKARAYVKVISDVISSIQIVPGDAGARQAVVQILSGVMSILLVIG